MNVISLLEVLNSVADRIPTPDGWADGALDQANLPSFLSSSNSEMSPHLRELAIGIFSDYFLLAYRISYAAGLLDYLLDRDECIQWLDWGPTDWPKTSQSARAEGLSKLVFASRTIDRCKQAYQTGHFDRMPISDEAQHLTRRFDKPADWKRAKEIGFDYEELVKFFRQHQIPSTLIDTLEDLPLNDSEIDISPPALPEATANTVSIPPPVPKTESSMADLPSRTHTSEPKRRRNELDRAIEKAIEQAGNDYTSDVWLMLKDIAIDEEPPFTGEVSSDGFWYTTSKTNEPVVLTKDQLDSRLRRRRERLRLATRGDA